MEAVGLENGRAELKRWKRQNGNLKAAKERTKKEKEKGKKSTDNYDIKIDYQGLKMHQEKGGENIKAGKAYGSRQR